MHRVAPDDLSETLFQKEGYFTISLPLIVVKPEKFNRHGSILMTRHPGQLLHLGRWNEQQVERLKSEISPHAFQSQYQQKPHDKLDRPELIILDQRGVGLGIYQEFQKEQWPHVMEAGSDVSSNDSKIDRFATALIPMYDGIVRFPK